MSSRMYLEKNIVDMRTLLVKAVTGKFDSFDSANQVYERLRRRLTSLAVILGPVPQFITDSANIWDFWNGYIKGKIPDYETRREFIKTNFTEYYANLLDNLATRSFEEVLLLRDIAIGDGIGEGGFGVVYKGEHIVLEESRAIKKLEPLFATEDDNIIALKRFAREAKMLSKLNHRNIVKVYDAGIAGEHPYIIMDFIEGINLSKHIDDFGVFTENTSLAVMKDVVSAVAAAHQSGIVHRDIKPKNIMWTGNEAVVLDFGAGQWLEFSLSTRMTTAPIGTIGYIAPELYDDPYLLNKNIDCYSVGVLFHYLLTGRIPNTGNPSYYLEEKGVGQGTIKLIIKSISPPPLRYQDGVEMLDALNAITSA
jgi:eukaryotic-like serine/threonine-protein kinase